MEFNLRLQEYIELVRARKLADAILYARKHLTPWSETHLKEIQRAMGLMAFTPDSTCENYRVGSAFVFQDNNPRIDDLIMTCHESN